MDCWYNSNTDCIIWDIYVIKMNPLEIYTELVNWVFVIYLLISVYGTDCFSTSRWVLTFIILIFSYFMRYVSRTKEE